MFQTYLARTKHSRVRLWRSNSSLSRIDKKLHMAATCMMQSSCYRQCFGTGKLPSKSRGVLDRGSLLTRIPVQRRIGSIKPSIGRLAPCCKAAARQVSSSGRSDGQSQEAGVVLPKISGHNFLKLFGNMAQGAAVAALALALVSTFSSTRD